MNNLDHTYTILIARVLSGEASEADRKEFNQWLGQSEGNRDIFRQYEAVWQLSDLSSQDIHPDRQAAWANVQHRIEQEESLSEPDEASPPQPSFSRPRIIPLHRKLYAATAIAATMLLFVAFYFLFTEQEPPLVTKQSEASTGEPLILPDGSSVYLQADAAIHYPESFQRRKRQVTLEGNAYFEIISADAPFRVMLADAVVEVLGTSFEIIQDKDNEIIRLSVVSGLVRFQSILFSEPGMLLTAGEGAELNRSTQTSTKFLIQNHNFLAWKTGLLEFNEEPLESVFLVLQETYGISIESRGDFSNYKLTGRFRDEAVDDIFQTIGMIFPLDIQQDNQTFKVQPAKNH